MGSIRRALIDAYRAGMAAGFGHDPAGGETKLAEPLGTEDGVVVCRARDTAGELEAAGEALAVARSEADDGQRRWAAAG